MTHAAQGVSVPWSEGAQALGLTFFFGPAHYILSCVIYVCVFILLFGANLKSVRPTPVVSLSRMPLTSHPFNLIRCKGLNYEIAFFEIHAGLYLTAQAQIRSVDLVPAAVGP